MCYKLRDVLLFFAGAEFFHTLHHVFLSYFVSLPMEMKFMVMTPTMNKYMIVINASFTVLLLWGAGRVCKSDCNWLCKSECKKEMKVEPKKQVKKIKNNR